MKIVSWNINSLRKRQDRFLSWLAATDPDIVCLQETKCTDEQFPVLDLKAVGYHSVFHGQKSYNGVAIISKSEPSEVRTALCDEEEDPQARVIAATISGLRVYSIYAPNGQAVGSPAYDYKMRWYERLRSCLQRENRDEPLVVCGDFNVAPKDEDVYDPDLWRGAIMCSDEERRAFDNLFKHCKYDPGGSFAYRWECALHRLDQTNADELQEAIRAHIRVLKPA